MNIDQITEQLRKMRLTTMAQSLKQRLEHEDNKELTHLEFIALLVEDEFYARKDRRMRRMIRKANFKPELPCIEDLTYDSTRGFTKKDIMPFTTPKWIQDALNLVIIGATGTGKTFLAEAIAYQSCRLEYPALKIRYPLLFEEIHNAKGTGMYLKFLKKISTIKVLIIDDFLMNSTSEEDAGFLLDVIDEKQQTGSIIITSQYPINKWHQKIPDPTISDAICDRIINRSYKFNLKGESMRKKKSNPT